MPRRWKACLRSGSTAGRGNRRQRWIDRWHARSAGKIWRSNSRDRSAKPGYLGRAQCRNCGCRRRIYRAAGRGRHVDRGQAREDGAGARQQSGVRRGLFGRDYGGQHGVGVLAPFYVGHGYDHSPTLDEMLDNGRPWPILLGTFVVRRETILAVGGFAEEFGREYGAEDAFAYLRIRELGEILYVPREADAVPNAAVRAKAGKVSSPASREREIGRRAGP